MTWLRVHALLLAVALFALSAPGRAGYREVHTTGYSMRVHLDDVGASLIEHAISYRVVSGTLTGLELSGVEPAAAIDPDATVTTEDGRKLEAHATLEAPHDGQTDAQVHVDVMEPNGLKRGLYTITLRYRVDLAANGALRRDGAMWKLAWTSPSMPEGIDTERVVFDLPTAPTEPSALPDDGVLSTLRRTPDRDELELVRLHVPRGERVTWNARVDSKAFPALRKAEVRPAPPRSDDAIRTQQRQTWLLVAFVGVLYAWLVAVKSRRAGAGVGPVVCLPAPWRALLAGAAMAGGVLLQLAAYFTSGASLLAVAMLMAAHRPARLAPRPRGPGSWSSVRAEDAFRRAPRPGDAFDVCTRTGQFWLFAFGAGVAAAALATARAHGAPSATLLVVDAVVALPIFFTGTRADAAPDLAEAPIGLLKPLFAALKKHAAVVRVVPWARVPMLTQSYDELRLLVLPRASMPGLVGIEVGVAWPRTTARAAGTPEILVRVHDASAAAAKLVSMAPGARSCPGRKLNERVVRLLPSMPTQHATRHLVLELSRAFVDRRAPAKDDAWAGLERRLPPKDRLALLRAA